MEELLLVKDSFFLRENEYKSKYGQLEFFFFLGILSLDALSSRKLQIIPRDDTLELGSEIVSVLT